MINTRNIWDSKKTQLPYQIKHLCQQNDRSTTMTVKLKYSTNWIINLNCVFSNMFHYFCVYKWSAVLPRIDLPETSKLSTSTNENPNLTNSPWNRRFTVKHFDNAHMGMYCIAFSCTTRAVRTLYDAVLQYTVAPSSFKTHVARHSPDFHTYTLDSDFSVWQLPSGHPLRQINSSTKRKILW